MGEKNSFQNFTNLYEISKTLRFELKPTNNITREIIYGNTFELDKKRQEKRIFLLNLIDDLLRQYIDEIFNPENLVNISFDEYFLEIAENEVIKKSNKDKKREEQEKLKYKAKNELVKNITDLYNRFIPLYGIEGSVNFKTLLKEDVLKYLKDIKLGDKTDEGLNEDEIEIKKVLEIFKGKFTLLQDYIKSREKTIFSDETKKGSLIFRIVDENLKNFFDNKIEFDKIWGMFQDRKLDFIKKEFKITENDGDIFDLNYYKSCFLEDGIQKYNEKIGELRSKLNNIIQEIKNKNNEIKKENKGKNKDEKLNLIFVPKSLKKLDKQILGKRDKKNKNFEIKNVDELYIKLEELNSINLGDNGIEFTKNHILNLFKNIEDFDLSKIFLSKRAIETLSGKFFNDFHFLKKLLGNKKDGKLTLDENYSFKQLEDKLENYSKDRENAEKNSKDIFKDLYFKDEKIINENSTEYFSNFLKTFIYEFKTTFKTYKKYEENFGKLIIEYKNKEKGDLTSKEIIQDYSKSCLDIYRMVAYFFPQKKTKEGMEFVKTIDDEDIDFYSDLHLYFDENLIVDYFNLFRNFVSKKPYSAEKVNVNFDSSTFLKGWDKNKESANLGTIFRKKNADNKIGYEYFLCIINKDNTNILNENKELFEVKGEYYEKMNYKLMSDPSKDIPNLIEIDGKTVRKTGRKDGKTGKNNQLEEIKNKYLPKDINNIRENKSYIIGKDNFNKQSLDTFISYYQKRLKEYYNGIFDFKFKNDYNTWEKFLEDVKSQTYLIDFNTKINKEVFENLSNDGKIFLFQIYSKDFSQKAGKNTQLDQQTNYFLGLFDEGNLENIKNRNGQIFKLGGEAKVFFRNKTKNLPSREKDGKVLKFIDKKDGNKEKEVKQNRRFADNKLIFHFPITINLGKNEFDFTKKEGRDKFNNKINEKLIKTGEFKKVIGLDRGEKHLVYLSLIDENGKILPDGSRTLNLAGKNKDGNKVDFKKLIENIEKDRLDQRKTWKEITEIKNKKEGYISQIVKEIADLAIKEKAIIVMEDLSSLKNSSRTKGIEKQVYSKFEYNLIKKLNYYVEKNGSDTDYRNGLQLTPYFYNMDIKDIDKSNQLGIIYYVNPNYTSQTCPNCGFVRDIYLEHKNLTKSAERLYDFTITFENNEFKFYKKEVKIELKVKKLENTKTKIEKEITFYSGVERLRKNRENTEKKWKTKEYNATEELTKLFKEFEINTNGNMVQQIIEKKNKDLYERLFQIINAILSIRNSETERETLEHKKENEDYTAKDFIACPVCKYHSEKKENISKSGKNREIEKLENADANGAYNIARKGVIVLNKVKAGNTDLFVSDEDWKKYLDKLKKS